MDGGALGWIRTSDRELSGNLLYPLSYERLAGRDCSPGPHPYYPLVGIECRVVFDSEEVLVIARFLQEHSEN